MPELSLVTSIIIVKTKYLDLNLYSSCGTGPVRIIMQQGIR